MRRRHLAVGAATAVTALVLTACGGSSGGASGTAGGSSKAAAGGSQLKGTGAFTLVQGKDTSPTGIVQKLLDGWNADHPTEKGKLIELPESADAQRAAMIRTAQAKSDTYDVLVVDNVWTAEFAANRYILPLPDNAAAEGMLEPVLNSAKYLGKLYAVPNTSDGGMLYYRTDLLKAANIAAPPTKWSEMIDDCKKIQATPEGKGAACYAGQFEKYEGLTVNASEAINSAGGVITDDKGKPDVNTDAAKAGLNFLVNGFKDGYIPKESITYKEEEGRRAFQEGRLIFQRQWPYQYSLASATDGSSKVNGKFAVAPLPGLNGPGVSSLGGHAVGISTYSKHQKSALAFIKYFTSKASSQKYLEEAANAPVYTSIYEDAALQKKFPYLPVLKASILKAIPRPKVVRYGDATLAIQDAAYGAMTGKLTTDAAVKQLQTKLEALTK